MKSIIKSFRNPATEILVIIGMAISCFVLLNVADLISKILVEDNSKALSNATIYNLFYNNREAATPSDAISATPSNAIFSENIETATSSNVVFTENGEMDTNQAIVYTNRYAVQAAFKEFAIKLEGFENGNVFLRIPEISFNRAIDGFTVYVIIAENEAMDVELEGNKEKSKSPKTNSIIIGESLHKYAYTDNGKEYLETGDYRLNIDGVLKNNMAGGVDNTVYIFWNTCESGLKEYLVEQWLGWSPSVVLYSEHDLETVKSAFVKTMSEYSMSYMNDKSDYIGDYQNYWYRFYNSVFLAAGLIFSLFTCFGVSYLWVNKRKREFAIRKAYGYSTDGLFLLIIKDLFHMILPSVSVALLFQLIFNIFTGFSDMTWQMILFKIAIVFAGMLAIVLLNALHLLQKIKKFKAVFVNDEN